MRCTRAVVLALALAGSGGLAACGDSGTEPPAQLVAGELTIVAGDEQVDTVTQLLPEPIEVLVTTAADGALAVRVRRGGGAGASFTSHEGEVPVPGQLVNFVVTDPECGRPFAGSATTNAEGRAVERWELGTKAKECTMEARAVDQATGEPIVFSSATATALPDVVVENAEGGANVQIKSGLALDLHVKVGTLLDEHGNVVDVETVTPAWRLDTEPFGDTPGTPTDEGWAIAAQPDGRYYLTLWLGEWYGRYLVDWQPTCTGGAQCVGY